MSFFAIFLFISSFFAGELKINFQPCDMQTPDGYTKDCGESYADRGNGYSYGWACDLTPDSRDRDMVGTVESSLMIPDRYQSINGGVCDDDSWKIAVTNGEYVVTVLYSDPHYAGTSELCAVNGISASVDGLVVPKATPMTKSLDVTVTDGFITLSGSYDIPSKPSCTSWAAVTIAAKPIKVNFQPCDMTVPTGYIKDCGEQYADRGNGNSYGWHCDLTPDSRNRDDLNTVESSQMIPDRYNSINGGVCDSDVWKFEVANGVYDVTVKYSDIHHDSNTELCAVNGQSVAASPIMVPKGVPTDVSVTVTVTDGFISLSGDYGIPSTPSCSSYAAITIQMVAPLSSAETTAQQQTLLFYLQSESAEVVMYGFALVGLVSLVSTFYNFGRSKYAEIPEDAEV